MFCQPVVRTVSRLLRVSTSGGPVQRLTRYEICTPRQRRWHHDTCHCARALQSEGPRVSDCKIKYTWTVCIYMVYRSLCMRPILARLLLFTSVTPLKLRSKRRNGLKFRRRWGIQVLTLFDTFQRSPCFWPMKTVPRMLQALALADAGLHRSNIPDLTVNIRITAVNTHARTIKVGSK